MLVQLDFDAGSRHYSEVSVRELSDRCGMSKSAVADKLRELAGRRLVCICSGHSKRKEGGQRHGYHLGRNGESVRRCGQCACPPGRTVCPRGRTDVSAGADGLGAVKAVNSQAVDLRPPVSTFRRSGGIEEKANEKHRVREIAARLGVRPEMP